MRDLASASWNWIRSHWIVASRSALSRSNGRKRRLRANFGLAATAADVARFDARAFLRFSSQGALSAKRRLAFCFLSVEELEVRALLAALTPAQITHAYGVDQIVFGSIKGTGTGQTIAIINAYDAPNIVSDLAFFNKTYNLPNTDGKG